MGEEKAGDDLSRSDGTIKAVERLVRGGIITITISSFKIKTSRLPEKSDIIEQIAITLQNLEIKVHTG